MPVRLTSRDALRIFDLADIWAARTGHDVRLVSANDHVHDRGSAHYAGLALDFHSSDPDGLSAMLRRKGYRVLWRVRGHYAHVHVEDHRRMDSTQRSVRDPRPPARAVPASRSGSRNEPPERRTGRGRRSDVP